MKTFDTYEPVAAMQACMKKPVVVHAKQIGEPFRVNTLEGNYKQGKSGDYLMQGIDGELYICDASVFERTYGWVETAPQ
ncbi:MAG: PGDYG domain-containing protein [Leptothrix sp. (in: b-proteobacteria)]